MEMRSNFWELPPEDLNEEEWEALCDGCGKCCLKKDWDFITQSINYTRNPCLLLDTDTCRCVDYEHRKERMGANCVKITLTMASADWLPKTCAYRLRAHGLSLPVWHPLLTGKDTTPKAF